MAFIEQPALRMSVESGQRGASGRCCAATCRSENELSNELAHSSTDRARGPVDVVVSWCRLQPMGQTSRSNDAIGLPPADRLCSSLGPIPTSRDRLQTLRM